MPRFDDFIVYVDESGDHGLDSIDPEYPVFVLAFCLFKKEEYAHVVAPSMIELKFKYFGHDQTVLHERDIRKTMGPFGFLTNVNKRREFYEDISTMVTAAPFVLVASAIDKVRLRKAYMTPSNPYNLALSFGLERLFLHLDSLGCREGVLNLVFESRGRKEDDELELEFRRACAHNATRKRLPFEIQFSNKLSNSTGLQLADLVARPIGRKVINPNQRNMAYDVLEAKFRRCPRDGRIAGWGLKVFP